MSFAYRKDVLDNGIRVVTKSSRDARSLALGFWVGVGSSCEPADLSGVSHFIEHILFKGTRGRSAFDIANALESVGGTIDAFAGRESTAFICRCLPEQMRRSVDVVSDMLCDPAMRGDAIGLEKQVIFEEIRNYQDSPEDVVHELIARSVWKDNPLAKPTLRHRCSMNLHAPSIHSTRYGNKSSVFKLWFGPILRVRSAVILQFGGLPEP